jgi:hypothetical protein
MKLCTYITALQQRDLISLLFFQNKESRLKKRLKEHYYFSVHLYIKNVVPTSQNIQCLHYEGQSVNDVL